MNPIRRRRLPMLERYEEKVLLSAIPAVETSRIAEILTSAGVGAAQVQPVAVSTIQSSAPVALTVHSSAPAALTIQGSRSVVPAGPVAVRARLTEPVASSAVVGLAGINQINQGASSQPVAAGQSAAADRGAGATWLFGTNQINQEASSQPVAAGQSSDPTEVNPLANADGHQQGWA